MCGIAGIIDPEGSADRALLERMAAPLVKRGPDDGGRLCENGCALIHRRLAIIDVEGGRQPIMNEDCSLALVCNGEVYGFRELRQELKRKGHRFSSCSDSEVILHLYEEEGADGVSRLNGMFALAILHVREQKIFLARDRFGQKPLFYAAVGTRFAFASGPASLAAVPWVDRTLNRGVIADFLACQYVPAPQSIYCGIRKFPPHSFGLWHKGELTVQSYWSPVVSGGFSGSYAEAREELRARLSASVRRRLIADVPLGLFLSGGLDSSVVCALASERASEALQTFSIGFPEGKYDERQFAQTVARHLGTRHHFREVRTDDFECLERIVADFEEPFSDASMLPTALLSEFTRGHVKVALSGDGADELFGGYDRYRVLHIARFYAQVPEVLRRGLRTILTAILPPKTEERSVFGRLRRLVEISDLDGVAQYLAVISRYPYGLSEELLGGSVVDACREQAGLAFLEDHYRGHGPLAEGIMELDCKTYLPNDILVKVDRASMAHALEVRSPFLDPEVAELAFALPLRWKLNRREGKRIVKDALGGLLPPGIARRSKRGFGVPIARWFRQEWAAKTRALLLDGACVQNDLLRQEGLQQMLSEHCKHRADYSYPLFNALVLELWLRTSPHLA